MKLKVQQTTAPTDVPAALEEMATRAIVRGHFPSTAVAIRGDSLELVDLGALFHEAYQRKTSRGTAVHRFLAGWTRSRVGEGALPSAVGVMSRVQLGRGERKLPAAIAFVEWSDCRWALFEVLLTPAGALRVDTIRRRSAEMGDALPQGLGRWFSAGRRWGKFLELQREAISQTVH